MFVVFVLALSQDRILIMYFTLFQPCITDAHRCIDVYADAVHLYDWETPDLSPLYPELARLFFVSDQSMQSQSIFCLSRFLCHHDQNLETQIFQSIAKTAKVSCSS